VDAFLAELYLYELKHQCEFAQIAYIDLCNAISSHNAKRLWAALESFLIAATKISIIFWPQKDKYNKRGEDLRKLLSVEDTVAFRNRNARNDLEHFDERLEDWNAKSQLHNIMDSAILPDSSFATGTNMDYLRVFLTRRFVFKFENNEYEINPIHASIVELSKEVEDMRAVFRDRRLSST
jgi:hypothetical protein